MIYHYSFQVNARESELVILKSIQTGCGIAFSMKEGNVTKGIATVHLLKDISLGFLVYLAIAPSLQKKGHGCAFLTFIEDACCKHFSSQNITPKGMVWEVEKNKPDNASERALNFFKKNGGSVLPCRYSQPPLDGKEAVDMYLMYKGLDSTEADFNLIIHSIYFNKYHTVNEIDKALLMSLYEEITRA